jgi:hypothetical protein
MPVTPAELQTKLTEALAAVTNARPGIDSTVALIATQRQQIADLMANATDLTEAAATVDALLAKQQENAKALTDGAAAPGGGVP